MQDTTYIPAVLTAGSMTKVINHMMEVGGPTTPKRITKKGLRAAIEGGVSIEFISKSMFHRYGAYFSGAEAVAQYGPVGVEVRNESGSLIAVVMYSAHPAFGDKPVRAEVGAVVR